MKPRVLLVRTKTSADNTNALASGLSLTTISIGIVRIEATNVMKREIAIYFDSANSVLKFLASQAWKRAKHTTPRLTTPRGSRKARDCE